MKIILEIPYEQWEEILTNWDYWQDQSFAIQMAYMFRGAIMQAGYIKDNE